MGLFLEDYSKAERHVSMPWLFSRTIFSEVIIPLRKDWNVLKQHFGFDQKEIKY